VPKRVNVPGSGTVDALTANVVTRPVASAAFRKIEVVCTTVPAYARDVTVPALSALK
jgi:hypothetical protein